METDGRNTLRVLQYGGGYTVMKECKHRRVENGHNPKKVAMAFLPVYFCKILNRYIAPYLCQDCKYDKKEVKE